MDHTRSDDAKVTELKTEIEQHIEVETLRDLSMTRQLENLQKQVNDLSADMKILMDLWSQANGVLNFIKWLAGIGTIVGGSILFIKDHVK